MLIDQDKQEAEFPIRWLINIGIINLKLDLDEVTTVFIKMVAMFRYVSRIFF